jgi:hypothetical protein
MLVVLVITVFLLGSVLLTNESGKTYLAHYFETGKQLVDEQRKLDSLESDYKTKKLECDLFIEGEFYGNKNCIEDLKAIDQKKSDVLRNMVQMREGIGLP